MVSQIINHVKDPDLIKEIQKSLDEVDSDSICKVAILLCGYKSVTFNADTEEYECEKEIEPSTSSTDPSLQ